MPIYLFVLLLILSILYFIFRWKHDPSGKYKHESCFIKIGLYSTYANPIRKVSLLPSLHLVFCLLHFELQKRKKNIYISTKEVKGIKIN
jgi:hypothetical protein